MAFGHLQRLPKLHGLRYAHSAKVPHFGLWVNGKWAEAKSGQSDEVLNPATGDREATFACGDAADIDEAVKSAHESFRSGEWSELNPRARGRVLNRAAELLRSSLPEFVESWGISLAVFGVWR
eukprot:Skav231792  [mRNA]  locus=scaffold734:93869:94237:+ [translate_table: standard]